jgi:hypothetical protein
MNRLDFNWKRQLLLALIWVMGLGNHTFAQFFPGIGRVGVVGGVKVDAEGVVRSATLAEKNLLLQELRGQTQDAKGALANKSELRMVSLSKLQTVLTDHLQQSKPLTDEILYLAGLQRVEYVLVYPEQKDIVLAGPSEPWHVREDGNVVGKNSRRPVLRLEDLLVALRSGEATQREAMSVSIDPTPEGELRLQKLLSQVSGNGFDPQQMEGAMKQAFGPQQVKLTAVPKDSRMAQTLVAADYEMKRLAMNLEPSPIRGLTSYMEMIRNGGTGKGKQPRWWITSDYQALQHSEDMLAWKIVGSKVKAMTEDQYISKTGQRIGTGSGNKLAQKWSNQFTDNYYQLCLHQAVFGDLLNVMDLTVVAAMIQAHKLQQRAGCDLSLLMATDARTLVTPTYAVPKTLEAQCSFVRGSAGWTVSASGGVELNPWRTVSELSTVDNDVKLVHTRVAPASDHWWW